MTPNELVNVVARTLCARDQSGGFCANVGGSLGCKCGRGKALSHELCKASPYQLSVAGYEETARAIIPLAMSHERAAIVAWLRAYAASLVGIHSVVPGFLQGAANSIELGVSEGPGDD